MGATAAALGAELVSILQPDDAGGALHCRANVGWDSADVRPVPLASSWDAARRSRSTTRAAGVPAAV